ncbi:serine hydrolase domain-containing protein [Chryseolinea lacunae]|uniref:Serine hydrolase n=1 Tax=Chryseolinea lacunae TaxID=2801331 RepID=A0ABS1L3X6_9BACT|nr:serine hydrolase [Chryseolinea lacunae]MBL0745642.1 serine hydrolase [Chryseolinea lacunae]
MYKLTITIALIVALTHAIAQQQPAVHVKVMDGFPPNRESLVTMKNFREHPFSQWSFRNAGAALHVLMMPRSGAIHAFREKPDHTIATTVSPDTEGTPMSFEVMFREHDADGVIVVKDNTVLYEQYWNGLSRDYQHIWYSVSKSMASTALGILVENKKVDLTASPAHYIPELKGSAFERVTIQDVLNMSTAMGYTESYTDTANFYFKYYAVAANAREAKGAEADPKTAEVWSVYDFLTKKAFINKNLEPGVKFEYSSPNVDVISWLIARVSGVPYQEFLRENIWAKIGAEHDAFITVDKSHTPIATGGVNTTLRDAALFGHLILNRGKIDGKQIIPATWVDETLRLTAADKERYSKNHVYVNAKMPWVSYKNFWWILDETKGEYAGVGIHGQVIYINRSANCVIAYFSSQPVASSVGAYKAFVSKLNACRALAKGMSR